MQGFSKLIIGVILVLLTYPQVAFATATTNKTLVLQDSILPLNTQIKTKGFPVIGKDGEELFTIYSKSGDLMPAERARIISNRIQKMDSHSFNKDSLTTVNNSTSTEVYYQDKILFSISSLDTLNTKKTKTALANTYSALITNNLEIAESKYIPQNIFLKVGF